MRLHQSGAFSLLSSRWLFRVSSITYPSRPHLRSRQVEQKPPDLTNSMLSLACSETTVRDRDWNAGHRNGRTTTQPPDQGARQRVGGLGPMLAALVGGLGPTLAAFK